MYVMTVCDGIGIALQKLEAEAVTMTEKADTDANTIDAVGCVVV